MEEYTPRHNFIPQYQEVNTAPLEQLIDWVLHCRLPKTMIEQLDDDYMWLMFRVKLNKHKRYGTPAYQEEVDNALP